MGQPTAASQRAFQSWGRHPTSSPARIIRLTDREALPPPGGFGGSALVFGQGRSYGDVCLNNGETLLDTSGLDRIIDVDVETGVVRAESGTTLAEILSLSVPNGWFLPVLPGTKFVSLGGAIANDVHGKNHHVAGTFGRFVRQFELVRSSGERLLCSPNSNAELFNASIAGLGLTGLISWAELQMLPIVSDQIDVRTTRFETLDEFIGLSERANAESEYVVAWIDGLRPEGRGVLMQGDHAPRTGNTSRTSGRRSVRFAVPFDAPEWALNALSVRAFNTIYYLKSRASGARRNMHYDPFFFPLDAVADWNRGYGKRGLLQYQCVVPFGNARQSIGELLRQAARSRASSFLAVIKSFGNLPSPGMMSFPRPGITLSLDFANRGEKTVALLRGFDELVREANGAVYPAKDASMTGESFRAFFPQWENFSAYVDPAFSSSFWRRVTA